MRQPSCNFGGCDITAPLRGSASSRGGMVTAVVADSEVSSFTSTNWSVTGSGAEIAGVAAIPVPCESDPCPQPQP